MEDTSETVDINMIDSLEITEEEIEILKGDAVNNSVYSSSWIFNTLISLCELNETNWSTELENRLCTLWDLSTESEVVSLLNSYNFPNLAMEILKNVTKPRLIEIILGILGNTCSNPEVIDKIGNDKKLARQLLQCLISDDTPILIQLVRILQSIVCRIERYPQSNWGTYLKECEFFGDYLIFILKNSTNDDLLIEVMHLLNSVSCIEDSASQNNLLKELFNINNLIPALLESSMQVIPAEKDSHSTKQLKFIKSWVEVLIVIMNFNLVKFIKDYGQELTIVRQNIMEIIFRILEPYKEPYNVLSMDELNMNVIHGPITVLFSFRHFNKDIQTRIDFLTAVILYSLRRTDLQEEDPLKLTLRKLLRAYWLQLTRHCTKEYITEILLNLCEDDLRDYMNKMLCYFSNMEPKATEEEEEMEKIIVNFQKL